VGVSETDRQRSASHKNVDGHMIIEETNGNRSNIEAMSTRGGRVTNRIVA